MKFKFLVESILAEAKIDDAIAKAGLSAEDAAKAKGAFGAIGYRAGYINFLLKDDNFRQDGFSDVVNAFEKRRSSLEKKDINAYGSFEELKAAVEALGKTRSQKSAEIDNDAPILFQSDKYVVRLVKTFEAAVKYGQGSGWMTMEDAIKLNGEGFINEWIEKYPEKASQDRSEVKTDNSWCISTPDTQGEWFRKYSGTEGAVNPCYMILSKVDPRHDKFCIFPERHNFNARQRHQNNINHNVTEASMAESIGQDLYGKIRKHWEENYASQFNPAHEFLDIACPGRWTRNADGTIDVRGDFELSGYKFPEGRFPVKFNRVSGHFRCWSCNLVSLEGCPEVVEGYFNCASQRTPGRPDYRCLKSLKGGPKIVKGWNGDGFYCQNNDLESLEGGPVEVGGTYFCQNTNLKSLKGAPAKVDGDFVCSNNLLRDLTGGPTEVKGSYRCSDNLRMKSLEGAPEKVGGYFDISTTSNMTADKIKEELVGKPYYDSIDFQ